MKIKKEVEVTVCDICKKEGMVRTCNVCGKEACGEHWYMVKGNIRKQGNVWEGTKSLSLVVCHPCLRNNSIGVMNKIRLDRELIVDIEQRLGETKT